jgi:tRNA threonylcarbamoyladenosine biosynthesis protein TsaE
MEASRIDITRLENLTVTARELLRESGSDTLDHARVLALYGDLGAGKTAFTKILAKELGIIEEVTSPTFVVMKRYDIEKGPWRSLIHIDAYRLESEEELRVLGFQEWLLDPNALIVIEWADKVESSLPADTLRLRFVLEEEKRFLERL